MSEDTPRTIASSGELIRTGRLSAAQLLEDVLDRLAGTEPMVSAYAHVDADGARRAATAADEELRSGHDRGPLHGIPVGVKDVFLTHDMPTRAGSRVLERVALRGEATAVARLRRAGAVLVGKQVTHEFACGQDVPATRNPWDLAAYPGGSSAGAGVSVAVGSALAAIGTDAGGSVRKPAALTGTVGLKPTLGRISRHGIVPPSGSMDHVGIVSRTVRDAALMLQVLAGHVLEDPTTLDEPLTDYTAGLGDAVTGTRIGLLSHSAEDQVLDAVPVAVDVLRALGAEVVPVAAWSVRHAGLAGNVILAAEAGAAHVPWLREHPDAYTAATRRYLEAGALLPAAYLQGAYRLRRALRDDVRRVFETLRLDVLVNATTPLPAINLAEMVPGHHLARYTSNTIMANLTGLPAITVPCGFVRGMPVGLQVVGRPFAEPKVLGVAAAYEAATPWWALQPALAVQP